MLLLVLIEALRFTHTHTERHTRTRTHTHTHAHTPRSLPLGGDPPSPPQPACRGARSLARLQGSASWRSSRRPPPPQVLCWGKRLEVPFNPLTLSPTSNRRPSIAFLQGIPLQTAPAGGRLSRARRVPGAAGETRAQRPASSASPAGTARRCPTCGSQPEAPACRGDVSACIWAQGAGARARSPATSGLLLAISCIQWTAASRVSDNLSIIRAEGVVGPTGESLYSALKKKNLRLSLSCLRLPTCTVGKTKGRKTYPKRAVLPKPLPGEI
ncbi:uncharacterized protein LOC134475286 [Cavia porcellus]|uniref:uncharacterized protein LOC134475286 n=1 Tax=Cavia porcellus TaxID=10141 RepID=UPI002FDF990A